MTALAESYARLGPDGLGDADLLALLLGSRPLADSLLDRFGSVSGVAAASPPALRRIVGPTRAARLHAAFVLSQRAFAGPPPRSLVRSPADAAAWLVPRLAGLAHEELHVLFLDSRAGILAARRMSQGGMDHTVFDVRHLLGEALRIGARGLILAHNHPSGEVEPSLEDVIVTRRIVEGATLLGVEVQDHLIVAHGRWTSLAERGELSRPASWATRRPSA